MTTRINDLGQDKGAIKRLIDNWHAGWLAGDTQALLSLFSNDAVLMPQNQPAVIGKDAIRTLYDAFFARFSVKGEGELQEIEVSGDWGFFWIAYHLTVIPKDGGEPLEDKGKSVFILKRQDDASWVVRRLIDNSDLEPVSSK